MDPYYDFVKRLSDTPIAPPACNFYQGSEAEGEIRRHNLHLYLQRMAERRPRLLLVGEAPGYRGCRITGVPFTSRSILLSDRSPFDLFGETAGFRVPPEMYGVWREATATALWGTLIRLDVLPLLWNAFPFHPYQPDDPATNRTPTISETARGQRPLVSLIHLFAIEQVIAVGNKAAEALERWAIPAAKVRHPARGGQTSFGRGLEAQLSGCAYGSRAEK